MSHFTVPNHLSKYNLPLSTFIASNPEFTDFVVGAYIFSSPTGHQHHYHHDQPLLTLLLQRSLTDSYGGFWENPGGSVEPSDASLLHAVAREVFEETGLHVSGFIDLVCVDRWTSVKMDRVREVAKFSFVVEVREALEGNRDANGNGWTERVVRDEDEHQDLMWATEEQVREGVEGEGTLKFVNEQGWNLLRAFELCRQK